MTFSQRRVYFFIWLCVVWVLFLFLFSSSLFIIHRSKLATSELWPLNPVLPINFSFVSDSRYNFSESKISYQSMQKSWPASKKLAEKPLISRKCPKMPLGHRLVPTVLIQHQPYGCFSHYSVLSSHAPWHARAHTHICTHRHAPTLPFSTHCHSPAAHRQGHAALALSQGNLSENCTAHWRHLESFSSKAAALRCHVQIIHLCTRESPSSELW